MSLANEGIIDMQNRRWKLSAITIAAALTIGILTLFISTPSSAAPSTPSSAAPTTPSSAAPSTPSSAAPSTPSSAAPSNAALTKPLLAIAAAIAIAGGLIGTGNAQQGIGAAGMGIIAEKPEKFGQVLFFFVIPETLWIIGFVLGIILLLGIL
jgi:V/A-type H+/Na+-transporting ATPase subunit K